jgi:hypothetical protein
MFWLFPPSKDSTPSERVVLLFFIAAVFIILGIVALVFGFRAAPEKHDLAVALEHRGFICLGIGLAIIFAYWLYRQLVD